MKTLLLLRHAKSSWDDPNMSDFERPLNERGLQTAPFIGQVLNENQLKPDLIVSSPAVRAKETAKLVKGSADLEVYVEYVEKIYEASPLRLLEVLSEVASTVDTLLLVGHNPGMEGLLRSLTGESHSIPTAGLIKVSLNISKWNEIANDSGKIEMFIKPREEMKGISA